MPRRLFALAGLALLPTLSAWAQPRRVPEARVVAELIEAGPRTPHCGGMHFLVPMRYRVVAVERGALTASQVIDVVVSCPELSRVRFVAGERHRLALASRRPWTTGALVPWPGHPAPARWWWATAVTAA